MECPWLLYSLEEKAKAAGGYVHFILGNHEIMNLQGDHRTPKKYTENAVLLGKPQTELYGAENPLGRWLRSKHVVEKIVDLLFAHGGIYREINQSALTVVEINRLARPHYVRIVRSTGNRARFVG